MTDIIANNIISSQPAVTQSISADPYQTQSMNLHNYPILEALHPNNDQRSNSNNSNSPLIGATTNNDNITQHSHSPLLNPVNNNKHNYHHTSPPLHSTNYNNNKHPRIQAIQPQLRSIASAPDQPVYNNVGNIPNGTKYVQQFSNNNQYYQQQQQQQQSNMMRQRSDGTQSADYYNNIPSSPHNLYQQPSYSSAKSTGHHSISYSASMPPNNNNNQSNNTNNNNTGGVTHQLSINTLHPQQQQQHTANVYNYNQPQLNATHTGSQSAPYYKDQKYYNQNNTQQQHQQQQQRTVNKQQYTKQELHQRYLAYAEYYRQYQLQLQQNQNQNQNQYQSSNNFQQLQQLHNKQHYTTNNKKISNYNLRDNEECVAFLLETIKKQNEEIRLCQQEILSLRKKNDTQKKLEEDFFSFLARIEFPKSLSISGKKDALNKLFKQEIEAKQYEIQCAKIFRRDAASKNLMLETNIIELTDELASIRDYLEQEKHKNYLDSVNYNKKLALNKCNNNNNNHYIGYNNNNNKYRLNNNGNNLMDYPPENIIIQNLIRTQIEFYFSDYNLKRDKRLLDQLCSDRIGFLKIDSVMNLSRVRQLSSHRNQVVNSLKHSKILTLTADNEWVGRLGFVRPLEKQFPFRRTVFVFGLPLDCTEKYVTEMLSPFGKLSKVKFDHGPDTLDRLVSENMFNEIRVYRYRDFNTHILYNYKQEIMVGGSSEYKCNKCNKLKNCDEGFYETNSYQILICLQCAAASAELILEKCKQNKFNRRMIQLLCGKSPRLNITKTKTALAVFTSQRQASKCVYVRSRIAYDGCFTTHYHHYSKLKKEIALTLQPYADKLKEIPPRRVLSEVVKMNNIHNNNHNNSIVSHLTVMNNNTVPIALNYPINEPDIVDNAALSSEGSDLQSTSFQPVPNISITTSPNKLNISDISDNNNNNNDHSFSDDDNPKKQLIFTSPSLISTKSNVCSLTAPVTSGSGVYLMRPYWNKPINKIHNKSDNKSINNKKQQTTSTHEFFVDDIKK